MSAVLASLHAVVTGTEQHQLTVVCIIALVRKSSAAGWSATVKSAFTSGIVFVIRLEWYLQRLVYHLP